MESLIKVHFPKWAVVLYGLVAIALVPWIFDLAINLPSHHTARHWDTLWVGFDVIILATLLVTIFLAIKNSVWVIVPASALATLFLVDVWFDTLTAKPGKETVESISFGLLELLLSFLTFRIVFHILRSAAPNKNIELGIKP